MSYRFDKNYVLELSLRKRHPERETSQEIAMLTVGDRFPSFQLQAVTSTEPGREFALLTGDSHAGRWRVLFAWPMDFTFVCPTELAEFAARAPDFTARGCALLGFSTDTHYVHLAWRRSHPQLADLPYPMLADTRRELSAALGILHKQDGVCLRATYLVDPEGVIRWACVNDLSVGRNVDEVLRVLDALQTGELTPCNWRRGERTLDAA
jgi:peroxiredoxin (alkyl hydroperoxide reductase subunit C)